MRPRILFRGVGLCSTAWTVVHWMPGERLEALLGEPNKSDLNENLDWH